MSQTLNGSLKKDTLRLAIDEIVPNAKEWRKACNNQLGGRTPDGMLNGTDQDREQLRNLVKAIQHGMVS